MRRNKYTGLYWFADKMPVDKMPVDETPVKIARVEKMTAILWGQEELNAGLNEDT